MQKTFGFISIFFNLIVLISLAMGDAFDDTVTEIQDLEATLESTRASIAQELIELRENHPLNAPKDTFESDADYQNRLSELGVIVAEQREASLLQIADIQSQISALSRRVFLTEDIIGTLGTYDANNEFFPITFEIADRRIQAGLSVKKADAKMLFDNWEKVRITGWIAIDPGYRRGLARVNLAYPPLWKDGVMWELDEVYHLGNNNNVDWSPDGKYVATGNRKETEASLWRLSTGKVIKIRIEPGQDIGRGVTALAFSLDSQYIATGSVYAARGRSNWSKTTVWDLRSGQSIGVIEHGTGATVEAIAFSPNSASFATLNLRSGRSTGNVVRIWDLEGGQEIAALDHSGAVYAIAFSPDGRYLATGGQNRSGRSGGVVTLWDMSSSTVAWKAEQSDDIYAVDFSPNGRYLAIGGRDGQVTIWDVNTAQSVRQIEKVNTKFYAIAYSPDGEYLAVGGSDPRIFLYRIGTENITLETEIIWEKSIATGSEIRDLAWSPYGNLISDGNEVSRTLLNPEIHELKSEIVAEPAQASVTFAVPTTVSVDERFTVSVNVADVTGLSGGRFDLLFNADVLEVKDVNEGDFLSDSGEQIYIRVENIDNEKGEVTNINLARKNKGGTDGTGTLLKVTFRAKAVGSSLLTLSNLQLGNLRGQIIPSVVTNVRVAVKPGPDVDGNGKAVEPSLDVNGDGKVNILDLVYVSQHLGTAVTEAPSVDVNADGKIDILDLIIVSQHL